MLERHRVVAVARQRPLGAPPDVGVVKDVPETLPSVLVVGRDGEQAEQRVARDDLTIVAAQIEADFHLPVQRLGGRAGGGGGGGGEPGRAREAREGRPGLTGLGRGEGGGGDRGDGPRRSWWRAPRCS